MAEILQNKAGFTVTQQPGGGISNVFNVAAGKAQLGFTTADAAGAAVAGEGDFKGKAAPNPRLPADDDQGGDLQGPGAGGAHPPLARHVRHLGQSREVLDPQPDPSALRES